jgi:hypothetical protein
MTGPASGRLTGRKLILMRILWAATLVLFGVLSLAAIPQAIRSAGQDPAVWLEVALGVYYLSLALFIFWQRSDDWVACILSVTLITALNTDSLETVFGTGALSQQLELALAAISSTLLLCLFYIFPDGRFVPRWTRWAAAAAAGIQLWRIFFEEAYMASGFPLVGLLMLTAPVAQIYRYFRASDAVQRQQIKWVVFGLTVTALPLGIAVATLSGSFFETESAAEQLGYLLWLAFLVVFPLSIVISMLRYRLWDIDVIIRKTLVYGLLTAVLTGVYFGTVIVLQTLFGSLTGEQSPVVIVVSTLVIAALFSSLRGRVQAVIDRRFFRQKYDAEQVLERFAQTARDEVELEALTAEMVRIVEETMRPDAVGVWLKPAAHRVAAAAWRQEQK